MAGELSGALGTLKERMGAPTDVNPQPGSSPAGGAVPNPQARPTPAAQQQAAQAQAGAQLAAAPPAVPGLEEKDKAIRDLQARLQESEGNSKFLEGKLTQLIASQTQAPPPPPPEPEKPPPGFDQLPAEEQIKWHAKQEAKIIVQEALAKEREALQQSIGPILGKVREHDANLMEQTIRAKFPNLPYDEVRGELDKLAAEMPAMDPIDRAASVAAHANRVDWLQQPTATPPVVESVLPSMAAAAGQPRTRQQPTGPSRRDLLAEAADHMIHGRSVQAKGPIHELLHRHVQAGRRVDALKQQRILTGG